MVEWLESTRPSGAAVEGLSKATEIRDLLMAGVTRVDIP